MTALVSNQWVAEKRELIFANTAAYIAPAAIAGRTEEMKQLRDVLQRATEPSCLIISESLGAGKTFFLNHAFKRIYGADEERYAAKLVIDQVEPQRAPDFAEAKVVVLEELDRKSELHRIEEAVQTAFDWMEQGRMLILTGDFALLNPEIMGRIQETAQVRRLRLQPLDQTLLTEAIQKRISWQLQQSPPGLPAQEAEAAAAEATKDIVMLDLLHALLPASEPQGATFREVLGLLKELALHLPLDNDVCQFTPDTAREWLRKSPPRKPNKLQSQFVERLYGEIVRRSTEDEQWYPVEATDWPDLLELPASPNFTENVLEPMVRAQVLLPMGIPYAPPERRELPSPYLPTVRTFLRALMGE